MNISLIVACDMSNAIGKDNSLLLRIKPDLQRFKQLTLNKTIIMGRNTYLSIGKPLPNRTNIILSKDTSYDPHPNAYVYNSLEDILIEIQNYSENEEVFICGGEQIYKLFLPYANKIYLTRINHYFDNVDAYFPHINPEEWEVEHTSDAHEYNGFSYRYIDMVRTQPLIK